ncbi:PREDICTED: uncharacterized protein LOC104601691 [Nelumbo nucifera]|uniref:Uncharacterized protein LOC104601691 n=1 Tax=Nelumbo nucifera TaxID=4432 RepID=A0A1U8AD77_NELNU|nr:PREDICTED: uncharacterized protein LOC104601691 [Nelumbo nucifera]
MENPFFRNYWSSTHPRYCSPNLRIIPVSHHMKSPSTNVISIPIRFVSEEKRPAAALKIQKCFRGFLIRKNVKKIIEIKKEVDEVEQRISRRKTVDLIRTDAKEQLRVNETLMSLLFRLDSVRGVDSGVRECRKKVIKKAIALQEKMDAIVAGDQAATVVDGVGSNGQILGGDDGVGSSSGTSETFAGDGDRFLDLRESTDSSDRCEATVSQALEIEHPASSLYDSRILCNSNDQTLEIGDSYMIDSVDREQQSEDTIQTLALRVGPEENCDAQVETQDAERETSGSGSVETLQDIYPTPLAGGDVTEETTETEKPKESSEKSHENLIKEGKEGRTEKEVNGMEIQQYETKSEGCVTVDEKENREENVSNRKMMERMIEDNGRLMELMTELFERNAEQSRLMSSLTQMVQQLEKAFMCERLKRKKTRRGRQRAQLRDMIPHLALENRGVRGGNPIEHQNY